MMSVAERPLLHVGLDPEALRNLLTRKHVILPASGTGELRREPYSPSTAPP
jgi:hypothetical protein